VSSGKNRYDFISPVAVCFPNCESEKVIAWSKRGKIHRRKEYHIFSLLFREKSSGHVNFLTGADSERVNAEGAESEG
jgi:hypothetical protein